MHTQGRRYSLNWQHVVLHKARDSSVQNYSALHRAKGYLRHCPLDWEWEVICLPSLWIQPLSPHLWKSFYTETSPRLINMLFSESQKQNPKPSLNSLFLSSFQPVFFCFFSSKCLRRDILFLSFLHWFSVVFSATVPVPRKHSINIYWRDRLLYPHKSPEMVLSKITFQSPNPVGIWRGLSFWSCLHFIALFLKIFVLDLFLHLASVTLYFS